MKISTAVSLPLCGTDQGFGKALPNKIPWGAKWAIAKFGPMVESCSMLPSLFVFADFQVHAFGAERCFGKMTKQKEPITQNIRNRREHGSRFKVMFYVIGSENSKSVSALYSSHQQNQRRGGAVRHFRCTDTVSDEPTNYVSTWSNIYIQLSATVDLLHQYYTNDVLFRQDCRMEASIWRNTFHWFGISKGKIYKLRNNTF